MPLSVSHFVSLEVSLIDMLRRIGSLAAAGHRTSVTMVRMEAIVHVAVEIARPVKPRTDTDEDPSGEPFWAVVAIWSTVIRRDVVVAVRTDRCHSDVDGYLSIRSWGHHREASPSNG
jgi:hypothetical protein